MIARIARRLRNEESGLSMAELLVAIMLTSLIMIMVANMFTQTASITTSAVQSGNSTGVASNSQQELGQVIRLATTVPTSGGTLAAITTATATKLELYALVDVTNPTNPAPTRVTFDTATGSLIETRCVASSSGGFWAFSSCASTSTRDLGGTFLAPGGGEKPLFSYLGSTGNEIVLVSGSVPSASLASIASITVSVKVQASGATTAPVYLSANVGMPNLGLQKESS